MTVTTGTGQPPSVQVRDYTLKGVSTLACDGYNWNGTAPSVQVRDYTLKGVSTLACDGYNWNGTAPKCSGT